jgi:hypothetical protein
MKIDPSLLLSLQVLTRNITTQANLQNDGILEKRAKAIKNHYTELHFAFFHAEGKPSDLARPRNVSTAARFVRHLRHLLNHGSPALKAWCHQVRERALLTEKYDKKARRAFLASTVGRAVDWPVSERLERKAQREAEDRFLGSPFNTRERVLKEVEQFVDRIFQKRRRKEMPIPIPSHKAVIGCPRDEGGCAQQLRRDLSTYYLGRSKRSWNFVGPMVAFPGNFKEDGVSLYRDKSPYRRALEGQSDKQEVKEQAEKDFKRCVDLQFTDTLAIPTRDEVLDLLDSEIPTAEITPIPEIGGKIRVASLHHAAETHAGRDLTRRYLRHLRDIVTTREMLRHETVTLSNADLGSQLYSADLKAATDFMPHDVAHRCVSRIAKHIGLPGDQKVIDTIFGSHVIAGRDSMSRRGVHMGLGLTWVALGVLNSFCADRAGAKKESYSVCGDDLIGLFTDVTRRRYERNLEEIGLVANKDKSFFGKRGVFCEMLVTKRVGENRVTAHARDVGHVSGLAASKYFARRTKARLAVMSELGKNRHPLSELMYDKVRPRNAGGGPVEFGGCGRGVASLSRLCRVAQHGTIPLQNTMDLRDYVEMDVEGETSERCTKTHNIPLEDLKIAVQTRFFLKYLQTPEWGQVGHLNEDKRFIQKRRNLPLNRANERWNKLRKQRGLVDNKDLERVISTSSLRSKDRKAGLFFTRKLVQSKDSAGRKRTIQRLQGILKRQRAKRFVSEEVALGVLGKIGRIPDGDDTLARWLPHNSGVTLEL